MHIILGFLGTIVTILILLNRLAEAGIDLGGLNPFLWHRRNKWRKKFEGNPIYQIDSPMEVTALLMTATVKMDGDMSSEEKKALMSAFQNEFHLSKRDAAGLIVSSAYLLGKGDDVRQNLDNIMKPSLEKFTQDQVQSALQMLEKLCDIDSAGVELKREFIGQVRNAFNKLIKTPGKWE